MTAPAVVEAVVSPVVRQVVPLVRAQLMTSGLLPLAMVAIAPVALTTPLNGSPVALVRVAAEGVPRFGVVSVGEVAKTRSAVPVAPVLVTPSNVRWPVTANVPGRDIFPLEFRVAVAEGVWEPWEPPPVMMAVLVREAADVTQVAQPTAPAALSVIGVVAETATVPAAAGRLTVTVPKAPVTGARVIVPDVAFLKSTEPTEVPATPRVNFEVPSVVMPATTFGAAPAPPPSTGEFAVSAAEVIQVELLLK